MKVPRWLTWCSGMVLFLLLLAAAWTVRAERRTTKFLQTMEAMDFDPMTDPPPWDPLTTFRTFPGNASEELLKIMGTRPNPKDGEKLLLSAAKRRSSEWPLVKPDIEILADQIGALNQLAKELHHEAVLLMNQEKFHEAEERFLAGLSIGDRLTRAGTLMEFMVGLAVQSLNKKDLPKLYALWRRSTKEKEAQLYADYIQRKILASMKFAATLNSEVRCLATPRGLEYVKHLAQHPAGQPIRFELIRLAAASWRYNLFEYFTGPSAFRKKIVREMTESLPPAARADLESADLYDLPGMKFSRQDMFMLLLR